MSATRVPDNALDDHEADERHLCDSLALVIEAAEARVTTAQAARVVSPRSRSTSPGSAPARDRDARPA